MSNAGFEEVFVVMHQIDVPARPGYIPHTVQGSPPVNVSMVVNARTSLVQAGFQALNFAEGRKARMESRGIQSEVRVLNNWTGSVVSQVYEIRKAEKCQSDDGDAERDEEKLVDEDGREDSRVGEADEEDEGAGESDGETLVTRELVWVVKHEISNDTE